MSDTHGITNTPTPPAAGHEHAAHSHHGHEGFGPFSAAEMAAFHHDDIKAGKAVILLMTAIFCIGVVLYTWVALSVV